MPPRAIPLGWRVIGLADVLVPFSSRDGFDLEVRAPQVSESVDHHSPPMTTAGLHRWPLVPILAA